MTSPSVRARETRKPDFPAVVHTYTDALRLLRDDGPIAASDLAERTARDPSNMRRDLHKLHDAGVIEPLSKGGGKESDRQWKITDKGRRWVDGADVAEGKASPPAPDTPAGRVQSLPKWPIDRLVANPTNRRLTAADIDTMADSIAAQGILQPLTVSPADDSGFRTIWIGHRRWRGAERAREEGRLPSSLADGLPFVERDATPAEAIAMTVIENVERQDIPPLELAFLLDDYAKAAGEDRKPLDAKSVAERLGLGVRDVQDKIRIARNASPEALTDYHEHGSWDRLRDSVTEKKAGAEQEAVAGARDIPDYIKPGTHALWEIPWQKPFRLAARVEVGERLEGGWTFATGLQTADGGSSYGLAFVGARNRGLATREAAVAAACDELYAGRHGVMPKGLPEWLAEVRQAAGLPADDLLPRQANHGGGSGARAADDPTTAATIEKVDQVVEEGRAAAAAADLAVLTNSDGHKRAKLALIEIAHKIGVDRRPLDPVKPAEWTGDVEEDFLTHGCTCGAHWLDPQIQQLIQLQAARVVQIPGGHPPMLALTETGLRYLLQYGCTLPIAGGALVTDQKIAGVSIPQVVGQVAYATTCLAREAAPPAEPDADRAAAHAADIVAAAPDPWDRTAEHVAEDAALLTQVQQLEGFVNGGIADDEAFQALGVRGARFNPAGWGELQGEDGTVLTTFVVDPHDERPDELGQALEILIARAINSVLGVE